MTKILGKLKGGSFGNLASKKSKDGDEGDDESDDDSEDERDKKKDKNPMTGVSGKAQKLLGDFTSKLGGGFGGGDLLGSLTGKKSKKSEDEEEEDESSSDEEEDETEGSSAKSKGNPLKNISGQAEKLLGGFTSKLGGGFGGGDLLGSLTGKKGKKSEDDEEKSGDKSSDDDNDEGGDTKDTGDSIKNPLSKLTGDLGGKSGDLLKGLSGDKGPGGIGGGLKDKVGSLFGGDKKEEKSYSFAWDETPEEKLARKKERLTEITKPSELKTRTVGAVFYASMELIRPGLAVFPIDAFNRWYSIEVRGRTDLPYDNGRAARDTNVPLKVILGPDHAYLVYADKYFEYYKDQKAGAKAIPVEIVKDYSSVYDEDIFWDRVVSDGDAYFMDSDGKDQKPPLAFKDVKDDSFLS
ncbi:MAG: hypothetical protein K2X98_06025, partial [Alphaproteobacteria bacterium]|nr:hypothetical protein [Alphaproteobacteria bacterium]